MADLYNTEEERLRKQGLPQAAQVAAPAQGGDQGLQPLTPTGLQELRSGDKSTYSPEAYAAAQKIPIIRGTTDSGLVPEKINNLQDLSNAIQGLGLNRAPSWQLSRSDPDRAKMVEANKLGQLKTLSDYANAYTTGQAHIEGARLSSEGKGSQQALVHEMMQKQDLEKAQSGSLQQFQEGLISSGAATLDPKTSKLSFSDPRYQQLFGDLSNALKGVTDRNAIPGIVYQYQQRLGQVNDWVKLSDKKVLQSLPDDFASDGQDLIQQMRGGKPGPPQLTNEEVDILRTKAIKGDASVLGLIKVLQDRKATRAVSTERAARIKNIGIERAANQVPDVWQPFTNIGQ